MKMGGMNKPIQIFKPGKHTAMSGVSLDFSESDLAASAKAYNPALHEAPIVVGHPKGDLPRYGGIGAISYADGHLNAEPRDVVPEFAELVNRKLYNKVSASFYSPDSPSNPVPGVWYLRHVGFLGAQPPAIKGLNPNGISFGDAEEGVIEFGEWDDVDNASLWRSLREWFIGKFGLDEADKVIPGYQVKSIEQGAQDELRESQTEGGGMTPSPAFHESTPKGDEMSAEDKARLAALEEENKALKAREAEFAESDRKRRADAAHADHLAFAETLIKDGKLLPGNKAVAVASLDFIAAQDKPVEFGEGDDKGTLTVDSFKAFLTTLPKQVEFSEVAGTDDKKTDALSDAEIAQRAREYKGRRDAAGGNISFAEAVDVVRAGKDKE